MELKLTMSSG